jgi:SRSO17 transposase
MGTHLVWPPGANPQLPEHTGLSGRPKTRFIDPHHEPISIADLAASLPRSAFRQVTWREGTRGKMSSNFAFLRVRSAEGHNERRPPSDEQWLLCEWPRDEDSPTKFYFSSLSPNTSHRELVRIIKLRWRVERDYQDLKQEVGLDHYEGRTWRGFHHHATLCSIAHAFLALRRALPPPEPSTLDTADGAASASDHFAATHRNLPSLQAANYVHGATARTVEDLANAIK